MHFFDLAIANNILVPFFGMMLLTLVVWVYMYLRRINYILQNGVAIDKLKNYEAIERIIPEAVNRPANNLKNLFELPILFYVVCLYLLIFKQVDLLSIYCAYGFLSIRIFHSIIHCTVNIVMWRFTAYFLFSICLWIMIVRSSLSVFNF